MRRTLIKYCGNRSLHDLQVTAESEADYLGFVFVQGSKRCVNPEEAASWLKQVRIGDKKIVGLFVNASPEKICSATDVVNLDVIQCHGNESAGEIKAIASATGLPVWKAIRHEKNGLKQMRDFSGTTAGYVVDSKVKGQWGGTGECFDWQAIPEYLAEARKQGVPCFIAGGVNEENAAELARYGPDGIDVSSGIEKGQRKDARVIKRLEERLIRHADLSR